MANLYVVRHGNTFEAGEAPRRVGARTDLPLTTAGLAQAEALGRHFAEAGIRFTAALSGPLLRTRQTAAAIIALQPGPPLLQTAGFLDEIDHGPDENRPEAGVAQRLGAAALLAWDQAGEVPPGWIVDAPARLAAWRSFAAGVDAGAAVLLVTSNGAARFALMALGLHASARSLKLATGAYGIIRVGQRLQPALVKWNERPD